MVISISTLTQTKINSCFDPHTLVIGHEVRVQKLGFVNLFFFFITIFCTHIYFKDYFLNLINYKNLSFSK